MIDTANSFSDPLAQKIVDFLWSIGIEVYKKQVNAGTFLPGLRIVEGTIWADEENFLSPGDILHEAGHLAQIPSHIRKTLTDTVAYDANLQGGEEMGAIAWSWAALKHLAIAPEVVFHPQGYKGNSQSIIENFSQGHYFGVPILQWKGLTLESHSAKPAGPPHFPNMIRWTVN